MNPEWTNQILTIVRLIGIIGFPTLIVFVLAARACVNSKNPKLAKIAAYILVYVAGAHIRLGAASKPLQ